MAQWLFEALDEVGDRIARSSHVLLGLDFDGTLAPIVDRPADADISVSLRNVLQSLVARPNVSVAVISGRERADLLARVGVPGLIYSGNHGLEISGPGHLFVEPHAAARSVAFQRLAAELAEALKYIPGVHVEFKGLTVCVHYRQVAEANRDAVRQVLDVVVADASPPIDLLQGEMAYEFRPQCDWNKYDAIQYLREQFGRPDSLVIFAGKGAVDEEVFANLRDGFSIRVGSAAKTAANYVVKDPDDMLRFLRWIESRALPPLARAG